VPDVASELLMLRRKPRTRSERRSKISPKASA